MCGPNEVDNTAVLKVTYKEKLGQKLSGFIQHMTFNYKEKEEILWTDI